MRAARKRITKISQNTKHFLFKTNYWYRTRCVRCTRHVYITRIVLQLGNSALVRLNNLCKATYSTPENQYFMLVLCHLKALALLTTQPSSKLENSKVKG